MEGKLKYKNLGRIFTFVALGIMGFGNFYNLIDFQRDMSSIKENYGFYGSRGDRLLYSIKHIDENRDFPRNLLTILSREKANDFIEEVERYPFTS